LTGQLLDLGLVRYEDALEFQREMMRERSLDHVPDTLILLEHEHVITLGRKTTPENFRPQAVPVYQVERGGDATYHGPGQLVGYPIIKLVDHDVRKHVHIIEDTLISTLHRFGIESATLEGHPGVWVGGRKKIASIGVAVTNWVSYHGFALNVNTDLSYFQLIQPCGMDPSTMTSMEKLLGRRPDIGEVKATVAEEFARRRGEEYVRSTIHPNISQLSVK
jgi:lipoate-protein ligase B